MDKLDHILSKKHDGDLPEGFIERIRLNFRRKYYFRQRMLALSAALLILAGFCVVLPSLAAANGQFNLSSTDVSGMPASDLSMSLQSSAAGVWQGITDLQDTILTTFSFPAWMGLFSVAIGSIIGIGRVFPRRRAR